MPKRGGPGGQLSKRQAIRRPPKFPVCCRMTINVVHQEMTRLHVPSPGFQNAQKNQTAIFFTQRHLAYFGPARDDQKARTLLRFENAKKTTKKQQMHFTNRIRALAAKTRRSRKAIAESTSDSTAAQLPIGSILISVACGRDSPRPKGCPGFGDLHTSK